MHTGSEEHRKEFRRTWIPYAVAALLYTLITILYTYPQVTVLSSGFVVSPIGSSSDYHLVIWDAWWAKKALLDLRTNPFYTSYLFYPNGTSLALHELTLLNSILTIPFQVLMKKPAGVIFGCNFVLMLTFVIAGLGMFALVRYLTRDNMAAFFAGAAFAFCPYRSMHIVHTALLSMGWIPLYLLFLLKTLRERKLLNPILASLFVGVTFLTCVMYTYFLILLTAFFLLYAVVAWREELLERRTCLRLSVLAGLSALILLPFLIGILRGGPVVSQPESMIDLFSANLLGYILPADKHVLYRFLFGLLPHFTYYLSGVPGHATFLTFSVIVLAGYALVKTPFRLTAFWLAMFLVFFIFSLGPVLHVGKWVTAVPLPYLALFKWLPFFSVMRTPYRFVILAELGIIVLASYGMNEAVVRLTGYSTGDADSRPHIWMRRAVAGGFTVLLLVELWNIPFGKRTLPIPEAYRTIGNEPGEFAVMDVPADTYPALAAYMYFQTLHEKPIPGGIISRPDPAAEQFLRDLLPKHPDDPAALSPAEAERLKQLGIKYVVYHQPGGDAQDILAVLKLY